VTQTPSSYFADDYYEARAAFLEAAQTCQARVTSVLHPTAKGPGGADIFMDCAELGPSDAPSALIVISGTHGPEGYCGSGVQVGLLQSGLAQKWAQSLRVILIHAHNAYGFAWDTRFNEDNIDLNRNYLESFSAPLPANPNYDLLASHAAPTSNDPAAREQAERSLLGFAAEHGFPALQAALTGGQYNHPKGVYYGGVAPSWSHLTLMDLVAKTTARARKIVSIDMHTGLGPYGHGEIISEAAPDSDHYARQTSIWGDQVCSTKDGSSVSADLSGTLDAALTRAFDPAWSVSIAIEFGTIDPMSVFRATQKSSWLHCYGDREGPDSKAIRAESRAAFYGQTDEWKTKVWDRSLDVIGKAATALSL
jgi:predicted deacylase